MLVNQDIESIVIAVRRISENPSRYQNTYIASARGSDISIFTEKGNDVKRRL